jgi:hypothetical protein
MVRLVLLVRRVLMVFQVLTERLEHLAQLGLPARRDLRVTHARLSFRFISMH